MTWQQVKLADVCIKITDGSHWSPKTCEIGFPMASVKDMEEYKINLSSCRKISEKDYYELVKNDCKPLKNDVLIAKDGSYLKHVFEVKNEEDVVILSSIAIIRPNLKNIIPTFLKYIFKNQEFVEIVKNHYVSGAVIPRIVLKDFRNIPILLPPLSVQKKIAAVLGALDDKIELNNKINSNLEQQAQALFKSWFVDFEPFGGKMPEDWEVGNLLDIADYLNGLAMQKFRPEENEKGLPVLKIKELRQGFCDASSEFCSPNVKSEYIIDNGDVIFSWSGSLLVDFWCGGKCGLNQHLFKVLSKKFDKWFYYSWTKHHLDRFIAVAADKATTMGHIKRDELEKAEVIIPSSTDYKKIAKILSPIKEMV
jgi:type I restriction enzyme S subunit